MKLGVIGLGHMGEALVRGFLSRHPGLESSVYLYEHHADKVATIVEDFPHVHVCASEHEVASLADVLVLAVKPYAICPLLRSLSLAESVGRLTILSVAASISLNSMAQCVPDGIGIVRAMPNTPCKCQTGVIAYDKNNYVSPKCEEFVTMFFSSCARVFYVPEEKLDIITAISGSGPAYMFLMLEAITECAEKHGLASDLALSLATETMLGAATMVKETSLYPACLREQVTSPNGTTLAGLQALDKARFREAIHLAVESAFRRALELRNENS